MSSNVYFPPEVWSMILENARHWKTRDELLHLWTGIRPLCRQFKEYVDDVFRAEHLPKTWLYLDTSM